MRNRRHDGSRSPAADPLERDLRGVLSDGRQKAESGSRNLHGI